MKQRRRNEIPFLQFESLSTNGRVEHAVFTRQGGVSPAPFASLNLSVSVPDSKRNVYANRSRAYGLYGRDTATVVHAYLVHGSDVARVTQQNNGRWVERIDGLITNEPGCALTMNYADCAPIFLYDPAIQAIGLGHAGWQGAVRDLPGAMVRVMQAAFGSDPAGLIAAIGPCIGPCCYEVSEPVISAVHSAFGEADTLLVSAAGDRRPFVPRRQRPRLRTSLRAGSRTDDEHLHFNLPEANRRNLLRAGVRHVEMSGFCTGCRTDLFFSHRVEQGRTGRFGAIFILT